MDLHADIVIIGEGLAGFAAALPLCDAGKDVLVLSRAPGATALSAGSWDLADHPARRYDDPWEERLDLTENLAERRRLQEFHPYRVLADGQSREGFAEFLLELAGHAARELPLPFSAPSRANRLFLTPFGTLHPAALVQASMEPATISSMEGAKVLVAGIRGFPAFSSRFLAQSLAELQQRQAKTYLSFCGSFDLELKGVSSASVEPFALAAFLDREENFVDFAKRLVEYLQEKVYTHVLLPPVMGLKNTAHILEAVRTVTGMQAAETLAAPASVPGFRLQQAIGAALAKRKVRRVTGEALGFEGGGGRVSRLRVVTSEGESAIFAKAFLLATGKYLGGGISRDEVFREGLFGLPVFLEGKVLRRETISSLARPGAGEPQPFLAAGVAINAQGQALGEGRKPAYDNLFAAGSVLEGFDPAHDRCAEGVAILSGTVAAQSALRAVG